MKKILIKILFRILGFKASSPCLVDGNDFIIKFNNKFYIMTSSTLEQRNDGTENLEIKFTDILSVIDKKENKKRWDF